MACATSSSCPIRLLRQTSKPVSGVDKATRKLFDDMLETMYEAPGIGLAAVQIGVPQRLVVIDLSKDGEEQPAAVHGQSGDHVGRARR